MASFNWTILVGMWSSRLVLSGTDVPWIKHQPREQILAVTTIFSFLLVCQRWALGHLKRGYDGAQLAAWGPGLERGRVCTIFHAWYLFIPLPHQWTHLNHLEESKPGCQTEFAWGRKLTLRIWGFCVLYPPYLLRHPPPPPPSRSHSRSFIIAACQVKDKTHNSPLTCYLDD